MIVIMSTPPLHTMLSTLPVRRVALGKGECLFRRGDRVSRVFLVLDGRVELIRSQPDGGTLVLQRAGAGAVLAEASLFSERYHCDAVAACVASVASYAKGPIRERLRHDPDFHQAWSEHLARELRTARVRSELLALRTVAARLDAWLALHDGELPPRGEWKSVAEQIGVSPEALYREIAQRR